MNIELAYHNKEITWLKALILLNKEIPSSTYNIQLLKSWDKENKELAKQAARKDKQTRLRALLLAVSNAGIDVKQLIENGDSLPEYFWNGLSENFCYYVYDTKTMTYEKASALGEQRAALEVIHWVDILAEYVDEMLPDYWGVDELIGLLDEHTKNHYDAFVKEWLNGNWDIPDPH